MCISTNEGAITFTKEPKDQGNLRHILRKYHYVRHRVEDRDIVINRISFEENHIDPFTKSLSREKHDDQAKTIGMRLDNDMM